MMDCHRLSWTVKDCQGLSRTVMDCHGQSYVDYQIGYILHFAWLRTDRQTYIGTCLLLQLKRMTLVIPTFEAPIDPMSLLLVSVQKFEPLKGLQNLFHNIILFWDTVYGKQIIIRYRNLCFESVCMFISNYSIVFPFH